MKLEYFLKNLIIKQKIILLWNHISEFYLFHWLLLIFEKFDFIFN